MSKDMLAAALRYADNGWAVFPLIANGKVPATEHGFKDATTDEARIREWFSNGRQCNLGIATGNGLLVVDVDVKNGVDGVATLATLGGLPDTKTVSTPSGGHHRYFTVEQDLPSSAGSLGPGVDVRGVGGYVVAPPSTINGTPYTWEDELPAQMLPDAVVRRIRDMRAAVDFHELDGQPVPIGQQEIVLNQRACSYRRGGLSRSGSVAALWADVQTWPQDPNRRPCTLADVERKVERAWRDLEPNVDVPLVASPLAQPATEWNGAELVNSEEPELVSLLVFAQPNIVIQSWSHLVAAAPKAGKTTFLAHIVRDWLNQGEKVLWLTEEPRSVWRRRLVRIGGDWSGLTLIPGDSSQEQALKARAAIGAETVVIVDTIRQFLPVRDWNDAAVIASAVRPWVTSICRTAGKTLMLAHHARKGGGEHGEEIAGSHELYAAVDLGIIIKHHGDDEQRRRKLTAVGREIEPTVLLYAMSDDDDRTLRYLGHPDAVGLAQVQTRVLDVLDGEWMSTEVIREALEDPKPSKQQMRNALNALAQSHRVDRDPPLAVSGERQRVMWRRHS